MWYREGQRGEKLWHLGWGMFCIAFPILIIAAIGGGLQAVLVTIGISAAILMVIVGIVLIVRALD